MNGMLSDFPFPEEIGEIGRRVGRGEEPLPRLWDVVERAGEKRETPGEVTVACGPGCSACCTVNVSVLFPEAAAIAAFLRMLPPEEFRSVAAAAAEVARKVRWMEDGERIRRGIGCAFLDSAGSCVIHPIRPMTCRSITSVDPGRCREALDEEEAVIVMDLRHKSLWEGAFLALAAGLEESGRFSRSRELCAAVTLLLENPGATEIPSA